MSAGEDTRERGLAAEIYLGIYMLFQLAAGNLIYRHLWKKYLEK